MSAIGEFYEIPKLLCAHCLHPVTMGEITKDMCAHVFCDHAACAQFGVKYSWFPMVLEIEPDEPAADP